MKKMKHEHLLSDMELACVDGLCPLCLQEKVRKLEMLVKLYDIVLGKLQIPVSMIYQAKDLLDQKKELLGEE